MIESVGPLVGVTAASQGVSALALLLTTLLGLDVADVYAVGVGIGGASLAGVTFGVVYPFVLGRPGQARWGWWAAGSALFAVVLGAAQGAYYFWLHGPPSAGDPVASVAIIAAFAIGGALLAAAGAYAVRNAVLGRPATLYSLTIPPNAAMMVVILLTMNDASRLGGGALPAIAWCLGSVVSFGFVVAIRRQGPVVIAREQARESRSNDALHLGALFLGVAASTVMPGFYTAALTQLPSGTATIANIAARIGSSVIGLGVNTVLMARYNWVTNHAFVRRIPLTLAGAATLAAVLLVVTVGAGSWWPRVATAALVWIVAAAASAIYLREANAKALGGALMSKALLDLIVTGLCATWLHLHPGLVSYFSVLLISQALTVFVCGVGLRDRLAQAICGPLAILSAVLVIVG